MIKEEDHRSVLDKVAAEESVDPRELFLDYFSRVEQHAQARGHHFATPDYGPEDIAASVFKSLCRALEAGRLTVIRDRNECLRLLLAMANRKIVNRIRYKQQLKRRASTGPIETDIERDLRESVEKDRKKSEPEYLAELNEIIEHATGLLGESLQQVLPLRLQGYRHEEIAAMLDVSPSTVARKLSLVRETWQEVLDDDLLDGES